MKLRDMNWMQVEDYLERDDRVVLPLGSVEQHAYLSLATDAILAERVALEAAGPVGVPVLPVQPYGLAPYFAAYPGTVTLREDSYRYLVEDILISVGRAGFRRVLVVNGHGGNAPAASVAEAWAGQSGDRAVLFHDWWRAPRTWAKVQEIEPDASHASWMEAFPWTRLEGVELPEGRKAMVDTSGRYEMSPEDFRERLGDGSFGGPYRRSDEEMLALWRVAVEETRERLESGW